MKKMNAASARRTNGGTWYNNKLTWMMFGDGYCSKRTTHEHYGVVDHSKTYTFDGKTVRLSWMKCATCGEKYKIENTGTSVRYCTQW